VEVQNGDVLRAESLASAMEGVQVAYYLVHSMTGGPDFHQRDLVGARNFGAAARAAGVDRLIYSEVWQTRGEPLGAPPLPAADGRGASRLGVPVTEFRAAVIIGSGSVSFEMIRHLTERLPVMICPRWVYSRRSP